MSNEGVSISDTNATLSYEAYPTAKLNEVLSKLGEFRISSLEKVHIFT